MGAELSAQETLKTAAKNLDKVEETSEAWGSISLSSPFLIPAPTGKNNPFAFDAKLDGEKAFNSARSDVQAAGGTFDESQLSVLLGATYQESLSLRDAALAAQKAKADNAAAASRARAFKTAAIEARYRAAISAIPTTATAREKDQKTALAEADRDDALATLETSSETPALSTDTLPPAPTDSILPTPKTDALSKSPAPGSLIRSGVSPQVSVRSALVTAAGDVATQGLFQVLGDPSQYGAASGKRVLFGTAMVNIDPGWRTQKGFIGEISSRIRYRYTPARLEIIKAAYVSPDTDLRIVQLIEKWSLRVTFRWESEEFTKRIQAMVDEQVATFKKSDPNSLDSSTKAKLQALTDFSNQLPLLTELAELLQGDPTYSDDFENEYTTAGKLLSSAGEAQLRVVLAELDKYHKFSKWARSSSAGVCPISFIARTKLERSVVDETPEDLDADFLEIHGSSSPLVAAVSPMTDVQSQDLSSSIRRRQEFALSLAAAMKSVDREADAKLFASFAKNLASDLAVRGAVPSVTSFSNSGGVVGFRIGPQLAPVLSPDGNQNASAAKQRLERQSFPVLLLIAIDPADLHLAFGRDGTPKEPQLKITQSARWLPLRRQWCPIFFPKRLSEERVADNAIATANALASLKALEGKEDDQRKQAKMSEEGIYAAESEEATSAMLHRAGKLRFEAISSYSVQSLPIDFFGVSKDLPAAKVSSISQIIPAVLAAGPVPADGRRFAIFGANLKGFTATAVLQGDASNKITLKTIPAGDSSLIVEIGGNLNPGPLAFQLADDSDPQQLLVTPPADVRAGVENSWAKKTTIDSGGSSTLTYEGSGTSADLVGQLIKNDLPPASAPPPVDAKHRRK